MNVHTQIVSAVLCAVTLAVAAFGQPATHPRSARPGPLTPCDGASSPSTCWSCFQDALEDCDRRNTEASRRQACYAAANQFFVNCLAPRTSKPGVGTLRTGASIPALNTWYGSTYSLEGRAPDFDDVWVFVRDTDEEGAIREQEVAAFPTVLADGSIMVVAEAPPACNGDCAGIVTAFVKDGVVVAAVAHVVAVTDGADLTGDGVVDIEDLGAAFARWEAGEGTEAELENLFHRLAE